MKAIEIQKREFEFPLIEKGHLSAQLRRCWERVLFKTLQWALRNPLRRNLWVLVIPFCKAEIYKKRAIGQQRVIILDITVFGIPSTGSGDSDT